MRSHLIASTLVLAISIACGGGGGGSTPLPTPTPAPVIPAPAAPTNLAAQAGDGSAVLTWTASSGAKGYNVKRWAYDQAGAAHYTQVGTATASTFTDPGLINGTVYRYIVTATNEGGESPSTPVVSADLTGKASLFAATPTWSDEFNDADGTLPSAASRGFQWTYDLGGGGWGNNELESYTNRTENAVVQGGNLLITAKKETYSGTDGVARNYTSARLKTQGLFSQRYGRIEARIKLPKGHGIWPAFWMLGDNITTAGWPTCGEIDIMENIGLEPATNHASLHGSTFAWNTPAGSLTATWSLASSALSDDFHTYTIEWVPDLIQFSVDGHVYQIRSKADMPAGGTWPFNAPFFLILNVAVGGWGGTPDDSIFPQQMLVDWVRIYGML